MPKNPKTSLIVGPGHVVCGKQAGESISESDVESELVLGALLAGGHLIRVPAEVPKASDTMTSANEDFPEEGH